jgi:oxygen-dependent protoporphyrinogen oxidase
MFALFTEPALQGLVRALLTEFMKEGRPDAQRNKDEPVATFVTRRLSQEVTDNLVSAVLHGIYAGDVYKLSAQTLLGPYRDLETKEQGVMVSLYDLREKGKRRLEMDTLLALRLIARDRPPHHFGRIGKLMQGTSVLTLRDEAGICTARETGQSSNLDWDRYQRN